MNIQEQCVSKEYCDFICSTPKGMHIETIFEDESLQCDIVSSCKNIFMCYLLPRATDSASTR